MHRNSGRRGLRRRGSEFEGAGCRIAARSSRQAGSGRESGEEGSDSLDATVGFDPDLFWCGRSSQCFRCDVHSDRFRRFYIERSSQHVIHPRCLSRYGLRAIRVGEASNPGPPKFLRRLRGASTISEVASTELQRKMSKLHSEKLVVHQLLWT